MSLHRLYAPSGSAYVESPEMYQPGGFYPVHIGDIYDSRSGTYRIVHKLGHGGSATVWLAYEERAGHYVALKILCAVGSRNCVELRMFLHLQNCSLGHPGRTFIASIKDHFILDSPNGRHVCMVFPVTGPSITHALWKWNPPCGFRRLYAGLAQDIVKQTAYGLQYLHSLRIVHGDLTTSNIVFQLDDFDALSQEDIYRRCGKPTKVRVLPSPRYIPSPHAPRYLVEPLDISKLSSELIKQEILIIDFGSAFFCNDLLVRTASGTPCSYRAPEAMFESLGGYASDIWALACAAFHIRSGRPLFKAFDGGKNEILAQMLDILGKFPKQWRFSRDWSKKEKQDEPAPKPGHALIDLIKAIGSRVKSEEHGVALLGSSSSRESFRTALEGDLEGEMSERIPDTKNKEGLASFQDIFGPSYPEDFFDSADTRIADAEAAALADLLDKMLNYNPVERIKIHQVVNHRWLWSQF